MPGSAQLMPRAEESPGSGHPALLPCVLGPCLAAGPLAARRLIAALHCVATVGHLLGRKNRLGSEDSQLEASLAHGGCEVHRFDPSIKAAHVQEGPRLWHHRLSVDWRDPNPAIAAHKLHSNTKKLGTIMSEFGHQKIDVLKADVESAEWKILENLILEDVVGQIGQLVVEVHVHWPGFEVSGNDSAVVRYWYSLLRELELKDFRLFHTYKDLAKPQMFLKKEAFNASSSYTLSWVNTAWK
ncbi:methyltransferase-like protein 24 [Nothoprocta perdicaria]|uniref:methyltransferase-like protein 24 n=1 Tax=Nothoprocta perdicaria TaxID=30464 RepID=UPI000E1BD5A1|nr:methyltransferase-like protein 24 [Nothoprocta perdicaria]